MIDTEHQRGLKGGKKRSNHEMGKELSEDAMKDKGDATISDENLRGAQRGVHDAKEIRLWFETWKDEFVPILKQIVMRFLRDRHSEANSSVDQMFDGEIKV